jgi:pimeloyl-ACP methyl ester carboxylesterase
MQYDTVWVGGIRSPIIRAGVAHASEAIVFLHGNPGSSGDWLDLLEPAGALGRAIAVDMPGFGQADKPADFDYTVAGYADHLGRLLAQEGIERVHFVLHDFGGPWGLEWASRHPERVASITLVNIGINPRFRWHYMAKIWRTPVLGELFMATTTRFGLKLALKHGNPRGLPEAAFNQMYANFDAATKRAILKLYRNTPDLGAMAQKWADILTPRQIPARVIWGAADPYVPVKMAERQRQYFAVDEVIRLEDSGHWPMLDNPPATRNAILPFLARQLGQENTD